MRYNKYIDYAIAGFFILFLVTFSNSIFLNQIGYYGALLLTLIKFYVSKENPFTKIGLEYSLLFFLGAELLSLIFTSDKSQGTTFFLRRALLMPIIYTTISVCSDYKKTVLYLKIYLGLAALLMLVYDIMAVPFYLNNQYTLTGAGPVFFKHGITSSEVMSFSLIIFFAFIINEKATIKERLLYIFLFLVSSAAIFATFKRTGWIGVGAAFVIMLAAKKYFKTLITFAVLVIVIFLLQKNESYYVIYKLEGKKADIVKTEHTDGRANSVLTEGDTLVIADFDKGIKVIRNNAVIAQKAYESPVVNILANGNDYILSLLNTKTVVVDKKSLEIKKEFLSPGLTFDVKAIDSLVYVLDKDSGLTVFGKSGDKAYYNKTLYNSGLFVNNNYTLTYDEGNFKLFSNREGLPEALVNLPKGISNAKGLINDNLILANKYVKIYNIASNIFSDSILIAGDVVRVKVKDSTICILTSKAQLYILCSNNGKLTAEKNYKLNTLPNDFVVNDHQLVTVFNKQSKLLSVFDLYVPSNFNRLAFWRAGLLIFRDNPIVGIGDIDFHKAYAEYKRPTDKEMQGHLHNNFMHILAALGIVGFFAFLYLLYKILKSNFIIFKKTKGLPVGNSFALGALGCVVFVIFSGLTEMNFYDHEIATLLWFTLGMNYSFYKTHLTNNNTEKL